MTILEKNRNISSKRRKCKKIKILVSVFRNMKEEIRLIKQALKIKETQGIRKVLEI